jgi:hypothetical protein
VVLNENHAYICSSTEPIYGGMFQRLDNRYKEDTAAFYLLYDIVRKEIAENKTKNSNSCANGLLWLTRYFISI